MYTIGQFAKKTGVTIRTLRYYDEKNLLKPAALSAGGQRLYDNSNLLTLQKIVTYKYLDFSLEDIVQLLKEDEPIADSFHRQRALLETKKQQIEKMLDTLDLAITIQEQTQIVEPTMLLLTMHSLFTEQQQIDYLSQYMKKETVDHLYRLLEEDLVALNRKYIELSYAIKHVYANYTKTQQLDEAELKDLLTRFLTIIPASLHQEIVDAFADIELEQFDDWLFPSPFTPTEEQWVIEQMEALHVLEVTLDEHTNS